MTRNTSGPRLGFRFEGLQKSLNNPTQGMLIMVTLRETIRTIRKLAFTGTISLLTANAAVAGLCCGDLPRAYYSPACEPAWGYHQTCWRRFPCLEPCTGWGDYCPTCERDDGVQYAGAWEEQPPVQGQIVPAAPLQGQYLQGVPMQGNVIHQNGGQQMAPMSSLQIPSAGGMQPAPYSPPAGAVPYYGGAPTHGGPTAPPQGGAGAPIPMNGNTPAPGPENGQRQMTPSPTNPYPSNTTPMPMDEDVLPMPSAEDQTRIYQMPNGYTQQTSYKGYRGPTNYGGHPIRQPQQVSQPAVQQQPQLYGGPQAGITGQQVPANGGWVQPQSNFIPGNHMPVNQGQGAAQGPFRSVSYGTPVQQPEQPAAAPVEVKRSLWSRLTGK
ncbi:hypothetical protein Fuma_04762 [Fuerstiella marisgermanici]|uniref:Uncharacterized protein n=2 Tax=Fuerstiella marisgermanici TaxID=1891926 RepID=A0A1P8WM28_9PLAN|nr:hypothetical protein Fuma_04762 [Fuerstiella marisgermanici]